MAGPSRAVETRREFLTRGDVPPEGRRLGGAAVRVFASSDRGARGLSTGTVTLAPGSELPALRHDRGESMTVLRGEVMIGVEHRSYRLRPFDSLHVPAGIVHAIGPLDGPGEAVVHWAIAGEWATWEEVGAYPPPTEAREATDEAVPERLVRFEAAPSYGLAEGTVFRDLFAGRLGARGICGGHGSFAPGTSLPCHFHDYDESITIVEGEAICQVAGREYRLSGCDTACVPRGRPHRFLNRSDRTMAMIWVYAGDEPDRVIVEPGHCDGSLAALPGA
jgi:quercetin dioxygenase-like cupin family protein